MARCPQFCTFRGRSPRCIRCGLPPRDPRTLAPPAADDPPEPARECLLPAFLVGLAPEQIEELRRIGAGNASEGVRRLLAHHNGT